MAKKHGIRGLVYISGTELSAANAWSLDFPNESVEIVSFGDSWKSRLCGVSDWSGSLASWGDTDDKVLYDAVNARADVAILIYPDRADNSTYYSGNAIFSGGESADVGSAYSRAWTFAGDGTLTATGWAT